MDFYFRRSYRGPVKLVVFDWAGTTIDYGCCGPAAVFVEGYRRKGIEISMAQARVPMGLEKREHIRVIGEMEAVVEQWQGVYGRAMTATDIDEMYNDFVPLLLDVLGNYSELIPGTVVAINNLRDMGCKIGATTGYFEAAQAIVQEAAARQGYVPDSSIGSTQVSAGRPAPWMMFQTMNRLNIYPAEAVVKVGDTRPDIAEGLNAAAWTIGVAQAGNEVGLAYDELMALDEESRQQKITAAKHTLAQEGAHFVVNTIADVPAIVVEINERLKRGERP